MDNFTFDVVFDASHTRAVHRTPEGDYVCAHMQVDGELPTPESVTLVGVGRTDSVDRAQMWLDTGIFVGKTYAN